MYTSRNVRAVTFFSLFFFFHFLHSAAPANPEEAEWHRYQSVLMHERAYRFVKDISDAEFEKRRLIHFSASKHAYQLLHNFIVNEELRIPISSDEFEELTNPDFGGELCNANFVTLQCSDGRVEIHNRFFRPEHHGSTIEVERTEDEVIKLVGYKYLLYFLNKLDQLEREDVLAKQAKFHAFGIQCARKWPFPF